jgi:hypothetical protein
MGKALDHMLIKYPDHSARIIELYSKDEDFRMLCEDFLDISQSLEKCRLNVIKGKEYKIEFEQVYIDLEKEIIRLMKPLGK